MRAVTGGKVTDIGLITAANGASAISAAIDFTGSRTVNVTAGGDTLALSGNLAIAAAGTVTKTGSGLLTITGAQNHGAGTTLAATAGTVTMNTNGGLNLTVSGSDAVLFNFGAAQNLGGLKATTNSTPTVASDYAVATGIFQIG